MRSRRLGLGRRAVEAGKLLLLGRKREERGFLRLQPAPRLQYRECEPREYDASRMRWLDTHWLEHVFVVPKLMEEHGVEDRSSSPGGQHASGGGRRGMRWHSLGMIRKLAIRDTGPTHVLTLGCSGCEP